MPLRIPGSLILVVGLVALGTVAGGGSLAVQEHQSRERARMEAAQLTGGDARRGKDAFRRLGCGACHAVAMLEGANGQVGPPLDKIAGRAVLAGQLPNTPAAMIAWLQHPQAIQPGSAMPDLGLDEATARDLAAYLYTLR